MRESVAQKVDVIRYEAYQEDTQHPVNNREGVPAAAKLAACALPLLAEHAQHSAVAVEKKHRWQQKRAQH